MPLFLKDEESILQMLVMKEEINPILIKILAQIQKILICKICKGKTISLMFVFNLQVIPMHLGTVQYHQCLAIILVYRQIIITHLILLHLLLHQVREEVITLDLNPQIITNINLLLNQQHNKLQCLSYLVHNQEVVRRN